MCCVDLSAALTVDLFFVPFSFVLLCLNVCRDHDVIGDDDFLGELWIDAEDVEDAVLDYPSTEEGEEAAKSFKERLVKGTTTKLLGRPGVNTDRIMVCGDLTGALAVLFAVLLVVGLFSLFLCLFPSLAHTHNTHTLSLSLSLFFLSPSTTTYSLGHQSTWKRSPRVGSRKRAS